MKKVMAFLGALSLLTCTVSCGEKPKTSESEPAVEEQVMQMSFKSADIEMAGEFKLIFNTDRRGAYFLIFGKNEKGEYCGYMTDTDFSEKRSFTVNAQEGEDVKCAAVMPGGKVAVLSVLGSHTYIYTFTTELEPENTYDLGDVYDTEDRFAQLVCADDGFYLNICRHDIGYVDKNGNYKGTVNIGGKNVSGITLDNSGAPCALLTEGVDTYLAALSEGSITEEISCGELTEYSNAICRGEGEYRIAAAVNTGIYGLKENRWIKLSDLSDNDFKTHEIFDIEMTAEGEFSAVIDREMSGIEMRLLSQRDISEIKQKKMIKLAKTYGSGIDPYTDLIKKYNAENDEYKIEFVDYYSDDPMVWIDPFEQLRLDIISGNCPDIICFDGGMPVESFGARESIFVDLYEYMDKDEDISREDFLEGYLPALETNGKLLRLSPSFQISTIVIKDKFAKGLKTWDIDGFQSVFDSMPADMALCEQSALYTRAEMFGLLMDLSQFIDLDRRECSYDSPEFIRVMNMMKDNEIGLTLKDYSSGGYGQELIYNFANDKTLLLCDIIRGVYEIRNIQQVYSGEPCTFIGFIGDKGTTASCHPTYSYGIMANSPYKDAAWDFLKHYMFSETSVESEGIFYGFPAIEKYYEKTLDAECTPVTYIDPETGEEKHDEVYTYYPDGMGDPVNINVTIQTP